MPENTLNCQDEASRKPEIPQESPTKSATDPQFVMNTRRGKGSERMIFHPNINGRAACFPITYHKKHDIGKGMLKAIIRRFDLPAGIFD
jgi:predicted RNA binding protein YcfA (HicA-like mRNA interferase family)